MPIFEYKCQQCGYVMEVLQKGRKATKQTCSQCGGTEMKKLLSGFSVAQAKPSAPSCDSCPSPGACDSGCCPASGFTM